MPDPTEDPRVAAYLRFRAELRTALRTLSPAALRSVIRRRIGGQDDQDADTRRLDALLAQPDEVLEPIIRRMILEDRQLAHLHAAARRWLLDRERAVRRPRPIAPTDRRRRRPDGGGTG